MDTLDAQDAKETQLLVERMIVSYIERKDSNQLMDELADFLSERMGTKELFDAACVTIKEGIRARVTPRVSMSRKVGLESVLTEREEVAHIRSIFRDNTEIIDTILGERSNSSGPMPVVNYMTEADDFAFEGLDPDTVCCYATLEVINRTGQDRTENMLRLESNSSNNKYNHKF